MTFLTPTAFQVFLSISGLMTGYIAAFIMSFIAACMKSVQFAQYTTSGMMMLAAFPRWTSHLTPWRKLGYFVCLVIVLLSYHSSIALERFGRYGMEYVVGENATIAIDFNLLATVPPSKCKDYLADNLQWYNCTAIADPREFQILPLEDQQFSTMFNDTSRGWTIDREDVETAWVSPQLYLQNGAFVALPDLSRSYPQNKSSVFEPDHVVLTNMTYFDVQSLYPISGRTHSGVYNALNIFATTQYNLGPKGLVDYYSDNSRLTQGIYAIQLDKDMILYYHVRVNSTHHAYNSTYCKDTPYGDMFMEHYANIADAGVPFSELDSNKVHNYTGHVADIGFEHTDSSFKVTLTSISQQNARLGYMSSNMCDTYYYQSEIRYKIVQTESTGGGTVAPAEFGTSIVTMDENGYKIAGISFCSSIALFNDPFARCDWGSFTKTIQYYHPLVKSVMSYKGDLPPSEIHVAGNKYSIKEGIYIGAAAKAVFGVIASLAAIFAIIQITVPGFGPYSSHAMDIIAAASLEEPGKLDAFPCVAFRYDGNHIDGYRVRLNGYEVQLRQYEQPGMSRKSLAPWAKESQSDTFSDADTVYRNSGVFRHPAYRNV